MLHKRFRSFRQFAIRYVFQKACDICDVQKTLLQSRKCRMKKEAVATHQTASFGDSFETMGQRSLKNFHANDVFGCDYAANCL